jgi:hypothetical protein
MTGLNRGLGWMGQMVVAFAFAGATSGFAQDVRTTLALPPAPLLPATLGKLTRVAEGDAGDGIGLVDAADAAVLKEDGLKRFARSDYKDDGSQHGTVLVYKFVDVSGAVAAFDYFRRPGPLGAAKMGDATAPGAGDAIVFRSGVNVVRESFNLHGEHVGTLMDELIGKLPKVGGTAALAPLLPTYLPAKGLEASSVRYALGPAGYESMGGVLPGGIVGFDKAGESVTAKYAGKGTLTVLLYPTPQIAGEHGREIVAALNKPGAANGTVLLRREGPLVLLTTGAWSAADARTMIERIHLRNELSFDKKMPLEFHAEVGKTYSLLQSIMVFCGVGAVAAIILGLFLGFGRATVRVWMGKPAASEPEFLRIDLRGKTVALRGDGGSSEPGSGVGAG